MLFKVWSGLGKHKATIGILVLGVFLTLHIIEKIVPIVTAARGPASVEKPIEETMMQYADKVAQTIEDKNSIRYHSLTKSLEDLGRRIDEQNGFIRELGKRVYDLNRDLNRDFNRRPADKDPKRNDSETAVATARNGDKK